MIDQLLIFAGVCGVALAPQVGLRLLRLLVIIRTLAIGPAGPAGQ